MRLAEEVRRLNVEAAKLSAQLAAVEQQRDRALAAWRTAVVEKQRGRVLDAWRTAVLESGRISERKREINEGAKS